MMSLMTSSEWLLRQIRGEFKEHPELRVTPWQLRQKWGLTPTESCLVIRQLLSVGFLREDYDGALVWDSWTKRH
jgi:hypothetical protein